VGLTNKEVIKLNRRKTTMKLRNILITAAAVGFMFASANRTDVVGYTAGDYADMNTFAHKAAGQNVAYTTGTDFTAVWTDGGTTWGFMGGSNQNLVDMMWSNGTYGVGFGLEMTPEVKNGSGVVTSKSETNMDIDFGMSLMDMDLGFNTNTGSGDMEINLRGGLGFWAFDTFTFGLDMDAEVLAADGIATKAVTVIDFATYGTYDWGAATGMFGLGFTSSDDVEGDYEDCTDEGETAGTNCTVGYAAINADGYTGINTNFSVESTLTDWCDLRVGYSKSFNMADNAVSDNYAVGLGFNYGSVGLDMVLSDGVLGSMMSNPLSYVNGRNTDALTTSWTLTYTW